MALALIQKLQAQGRACEHLDGDRIREVISGIGFSQEDRDRNVLTVAFIAQILQNNGIIPVVSMISPYRQAREKARSLCKDFVEIYVSTNLAECEKRDPKGLYKKARAGLIQKFTGVDDVYEVPEKAEFNWNTEGKNVDDFLHLLLPEVFIG